MEKKKSQPKRRICISEEVFGEFNDRMELELNEGSGLTEDERELVRSFMRGSILFQNLDAKDEEIIIRAVTAK